MWRRKVCLVFAFSNRETYIFSLQELHYFTLMLRVSTGLRLHQKILFHRSELFQAQSDLFCLELLPSQECTAVEQSRCSQLSEWTVSYGLSLNYIFQMFLYPSNQKGKIRFKLTGYSMCSDTIRGREMPSPEVTQCPRQRANMLEKQCRRRAVESQLLFQDVLS